MYEKNESLLKLVYGQVTRFKNTSPLFLCEDMILVAKGDGCDKIIDGIINVHTSKQYVGVRSSSKFILLNKLKGNIEKEYDNIINSTKHNIHNDKYTLFLLSNMSRNIELIVIDQQSGNIIHEISNVQGLRYKNAHFGYVINIANVDYGISKQGKLFKIGEMK